MSQHILTTRVTLACPHGGTVTMVPTATRVTVDGDPPLLAGDVGTIAGCAFTVGSAPSPCVRTEWSLPTVQLTIEGKGVLTTGSVALCISGPGAPQGTATISGQQTKVTAR